MTITSTSIGLSWSAPASGAGYVYTVLSRVTGSGAFSILADGVTGASYNVTGLSPNTSYDFQVFAHNQYGPGQASAIVTASTVAPAPNNPSGLILNAGTPSYSTVNVSWSAPSSDSTHGAATYYQVSYSINNTGTYSTPINVGNTLSASLSGLSHNTLYGVKVDAYDGGGSDAIGITGTITTTVAPPNAPTGLSIYNVINAYTVQFSWNAPATDSTHDAASSYTFNWGTDGVTWPNSISGISGTLQTVSTLPLNSTVHFEVISVNSGGNSMPDVAGFTLSTGNAPPNAPTSPTASAGSPAYSSAVVSWTAPTADATHSLASSYTVSYSSNGGSTWTQFATGITGTSTTVTGLSHNTSYLFKIVGVNSGGTGASVATASSLTTDYAPPNVPAITSVAPVTDGTVTKLAVTWSASSIDANHDAATGYDLQWSAHGANSWTVVTNVASGAVITGLSSGTSYDVQVRAKNSSTTSPSAWSASTTASTFSTVMSWNIAPGSTWTHSSTNAVNAHTTPNPSGAVGVNFSFSTSATTNTNASGPVAALGSGGYPISGNVWGAYLTAPATTGTYYVWAIVNDGSGKLVSSAVTVT